MSAIDSSNTKEKILYEGLALSSAKGFLNDTVGISLVTKEVLDEHKISKNEAKAEIANILRTVIGSKIGVSMVEE